MQKTRKRKDKIKMSEVKTSWTKATTDPSTAMISLVSCIEAGKNAWIEIRKNGDQAFPIMIPNPLLNNPFNWTQSYGTTRNDAERASHDYLNETEKDLTHNWVACYGTKEAIELYQTEGLITEGLCDGSICHPVRIKDANTYRSNITGDNYKYDYWTTYWKPKDGISYYVADESIGNVFTICYNDDPADKYTSLIKTAQFLTDYANRIGR